MVMVMVMVIICCSYVLNCFLMSSLISDDLHECLMIVNCCYYAVHEVRFMYVLMILIYSRRHFNNLLKCVIVSLRFSLLS